MKFQAPDMEISSSWIEAAGTQKNKKQKKAERQTNKQTSKQTRKQIAEKLHELASKKAEILEKVQV